MARDDPQVNIRLPIALRDRLNAAAEKLGRSFTAEVVARLDESFEGEQPTAEARLSEMLSSLHRAEATRNDMIEKIGALHAAKAANSKKWKRPAWLKPNATIDEAIQSYDWFLPVIDMEIHSLMTSINSLAYPGRKGR